MNRSKHSIQFWNSIIVPVLGILTLVYSSSLPGQFNSPLLVTDGSGGHQNPSLVSGSSDIMLIAMEKGEGILSTNSVAGFPVATEVLASEFSQGGPQIVPGALFNQYLVFHRIDSDPTADDREILFSQNPTGSFGDPQQITDDAFDNHHPSGALSDDGVLAVSWVRESSPGSMIYFRKGLELELEIDFGTKAKLINLDGVLTTVYQSGEEIKARAVIDGIVQPVVLLHSNSLPIEEWDVAGSGSNLGLIFRDTIGVRFSWGNPASMPAPQTLDLMSNLSGVSIDALPDGRCALFWTRSGDVHWQKLLDGTTGENGTVAALPPNCSGLSGSLDSHGHMHLVVLHDGGVLVINSVPTPVADFSISPASGVAPLEVNFTDLSEGVVNSLQWDFGDGTTDPYPEASHLYETPGAYDITLTVIGPGGSDTKVVNSGVIVNSPSDTVRIADIHVFAGQPVIHPLLASHVEPLQGFQIGFTYNSNFTPVSDFEFTSTQVGSLDPEFVVVQIDNQGPDSSMVAVVIFDTVQPFDGRTLPPGISQTLGNLIYTVPFPLPFNSVSPLTFTDNLGDPPLSNIFSTSSGTSIYPYKLHGSVTISQQPQFLFVRGDSNYDQSVNISDGIFLLSFLFSGGPPPTCPDSADGNDDGQLNVADAVMVLQFLFNSGETLPYPYPGAGLDPTSDDLGPCIPPSP